MRGVAGMVLAGGASRRLGTAKALVAVGGRRLVDRAADALRAAGMEAALIANDPAVTSGAGLEWRADRATGLGPLAGIMAGLGWAAEEGHRGAVFVACDMPFASAGLLRALRDRGAERVVLPESAGRRGIEPLCAYYPVAALPALEAALERGERALHTLLAALDVDRMPAREVAAFGDPDVIFFNVNTPADHERAERIARANGL